MLTLCLCSVRVPKYRRSLHRRSEVTLTVETLVILGGRARVLTSRPSQLAFLAAKAQRGARVTFQKLGRLQEDESYRELQEVLEVLGEAGLQVDSVSGELEEPRPQEQEGEELLASCPCSPLPLPLLSEAELRALVEDLQDGQEELFSLHLLPEVVPRRSSGSGAGLIKRGDLIEFCAGQGGKHDWFRVLVTGKGKATGKNRNYLNLRYADGSEGGVYIDKHRWRFCLEEWTGGWLAGGQENRRNSQEEEEEVVCREKRRENSSAMEEECSGRGRKRASVEMFGLEDGLSNMALGLGAEGGRTGFSGVLSSIRV